MSNKVKKIKKNHDPSTKEKEINEHDNVNPLTNHPYSLRYKEIEKVRQSLPAFKSKDNFLSLIKDNLILIVEGDTGSGKTT